jgi:hypothetical protein
MTRNIQLGLLVFSTLSLACRTESDGDWGEEETVVESQPGSNPSMNPDNIYEVQGSWLGRANSVYENDYLGFDGLSANIVVRVLEADELDGTAAAEIDVSLRLGLGQWMNGSGTGYLVANHNGEFDAVVESAIGTRCLVEGDWNADAGLVGADLSCVGADGAWSDYGFTANRF